MSEYIKIAIQTPDNGVSVMMFVTKQTNADPMDQHTIEEMIARRINEWDQQKAKYEQRDIDAYRQHLETKHIDWTQEPTEENIVQTINKAGISYISYMRIDNVPEDRTYRNAWKLDQGIITYDIDKCKALLVEEVRALRSERFAEIDKQYIIAQQKKEETGPIEKKAQYLRDLPALVNSEIKGFSSVEDFLEYIIPWESNP